MREGTNRWSPQRILSRILIDLRKLGYPRQQELDLGQHDPGLHVFERLTPRPTIRQLLRGLRCHSVQKVHIFVRMEPRHFHGRCPLRFLPSMLAGTLTQTKRKHAPHQNLHLGQHIIRRNEFVRDLDTVRLHWMSQSIRVRSNVGCWSSGEYRVPTAKPTQHRTHDHGSNLLFVSISRSFLLLELRSELRANYVRIRGERWRADTRRRLGRSEGEGRKILLQVVQAPDDYWPRSFFRHVCRRR